MEQRVRIKDLLSDPQRHRFASMPEADALTEPDALQEADLVDAHFEVQQSELAILFDLRTSLQFRMANTGLVVVRAVDTFEWTGEPMLGRRTAHYVMSSKPSITYEHFSIAISCLGGWRLSCRGRAAEFFVGNIEGLPSAPPDFIQDDPRVVASGMPVWDSSLEPEWATFWAPIPSPQ
jgi:hypothetical protein